MKKIQIGIGVILILLTLIFLGNSVNNAIFLRQYKAGQYNENRLKQIKLWNIYEPYVVHYNYGNAMYKQELYSLAYASYKKALKRFPSEERKCQIRINMALCRLKLLDVENSIPEELAIDDIEELLKELGITKEILFEHGCANEENDDGHNEQAEQLKKEIEEFEKKLQQQLESSESEEGESAEEENEEEKDGSSESELEASDEREQMLRELQKESTLDRNKEMEYYTIEYQYYSGDSW